MEMELQELNSACIETSIFSNVNEKNYLQFCQIALVQFKYLTETTDKSENHFENWKANFSNLFDFVYLNHFKVNTCNQFLQAYYGI
jgi:hypothetical protein